MTLLEVLITIVVLAVLTSVATLAPRPPTRKASELTVMLDDSLAAAVAEGRTITLVADVAGRRVSATVSPTGRVVADSELVSPPHDESRDDR
jgi:hypothetical protein